MTWHPTPRSPRPLRVKLTQSELASLDRLAKPRESRADTLRRLLNEQA